MSSTYSVRNKSIDWVSLTVYLCLVSIGWLMLYAVNYDPLSSESVLSINSDAGKQTVWIVLSLIFFGLTFLLDWKFWSTFSFLFYAVGILLLLLVLLIGYETKGSKSWFLIFGMSFQPSEFAKLATALAISSYLSLSNVTIKNRRQLLVAAGMFLLPSFLILLQPDAGSALVFFSFLLLLYMIGANQLYYIIGIGFITLVILSLIYEPLYVGAAAGVFATISMIYTKQVNRWLFLSSFLIIPLAYIFYNNGIFNYYLIGLTVLFLLTVIYNIRIPRYSRTYITSAVLFFTIFFSYSSNWVFNNVLKPHQQDRINVWLRPDRCDPRGSLYNIIQSKTAIGSGGFSGKGFLQGSMTQLNYVPEQKTDFIFAAIGEEQGFLGSVGVIVLFGILLMRLVLISNRAKNNFIKYYGYSLVGILFVHFFVNIGMTMGLMPVIGIPLPFISKGGSSLLVFSIMLGILLKMDMDRGSVL